MLDAVSCEILVESWMELRLFLPLFCWRMRM